MTLVCALLPHNKISASMGKSVFEVSVGSSTMYKGTQEELCISNTQGDLGPSCGPCSGL